jgi:3-methylcrotonyl-CoA carboxylase alpha subunit
MEDAGVPVVPGYHGAEQGDELLADQAARIGYPVLIKASAGGGGKGMRVVHSAAQFADALAAARREALKAFGDEQVILERYVERPRHIEVQVFGDRHGNVVHLWERECSTQRRYQKVIEESPSPLPDDALRERIAQAAVEAARAVDYLNAGTVEFMVSPEREFFFLEMNTRLQVEHPSPRWSPASTW